MPRGQTLKDFINSIIEDIDNGRVPQRRRIPGWVRSVALPAAIGIGAMGIGACDNTPAEAEEITKDEADVAKADNDTDWICELLKEDPGCDFCDLLGWNADGVCDDFCDPPDPDCASVLYAAPIEDCSDGVDNDGDGALDCCDDDCAESGECQVACPRYMAPLPPEENCGDCIDNDCDGVPDCEDSDCFEDPICPQIYPILPPPDLEYNCSDGVDNDGNDLIDCDDPDCFENPDCPPIYPILPAHEFDCFDGIDNDHDGLLDCADMEDCAEECEIYPVLPPDYEYNCSDGIDNDGDGLIDCDDRQDCFEDPDCPEIYPVLPPPDLEYNCSDGVDNDGNDLIDCDDPDCDENMDCIE